MEGRRNPRSSLEPMCCCEYENEAGEKSHILACCCDCQALDEAADRFLRCQRIPIKSLERLLSTITDRCRMPSVTGKGAVKVRLDVLTPIIMVPALLLFASLGPVATLIAFSIMPVFLLLFYQVWRRLGHHRTPFFFNWGLSSVITCYLVFQLLVVSFREVLLWEILLQLTSTVAMLYMLYKTKGNPGYLRSGEHSPTKRIKAELATPLANGTTPALYSHARGQAVGVRDTAVDMATSQLGTSVVVDTSSVNWVDSRPVRDNKLVTWCPSCSFHRPPRSGHCNICDACIAVRDHHCVWIDQCVGANNHRYFVAAMVLFVWCALYGSHLTLTSICTPIMIYDWFLWPNDCRFLYQNIYTSMSFVCAAYSLMATAAIFLALAYQLLLISQNVTSQELHTSISRGMVHYGFFPQGNLHNQGLFRNWLEFIFLPSRTVSAKIPSQ